VHEVLPRRFDGLAEALLLDVDMEGIHHNLHRWAADHVHRLESLLGQIDEARFETIKRLQSEGRST
jgi:hypothetical protein